MFCYSETATEGAANTLALPNQTSRRRAEVATNQVGPKRTTAQVECRVCGETKDASEFYPTQVRRAGDVGECRDCTKVRVRRRARTDPAVQEYDRKRAKTPERRAKARENTCKWRAENTSGYAAQTAVGNALRDGILKREPCLFCGRKDVHAHHRDYAKPLEVVWLCPKCHHRLHATFPETEGQNKAAPF